MVKRTPRRRHVVLTRVQASSDTFATCSLSDGYTTNPAMDRLLLRSPAESLCIPGYRKVCAVRSHELAAAGNRTVEEWTG